MLKLNCSTIMKAHLQFQHGPHKIRRGTCRILLQDTQILRFRYLTPDTQT